VPFLDREFLDVRRGVLPAAIAWDTSFTKNADPSGRAVLGVHEDANAKA
jgi:hypothetical protein